MQVKAQARYVRVTPLKARRVVDLIRGLHVDEARRVLQFSPQSATLPVRKVLDSAIANAEHHFSLPADELFVARAWVDEGPTLRRYRPRALGRATRIRKRTSHISIVVARFEEGARDVQGSGPGARRPQRRATGPAATDTERQG